MLIGFTDAIAGKPAPTYSAVIARARQLLPALAALLLSFPALFLWAQLPIGRCRGCTFSNLYRS